MDNINVLLKNNKNNFFANNYNRAKFYRILMDSGSFCIMIINKNY